MGRPVSIVTITERDGKARIRAKGRDEENDLKTCVERRLVIDLGSVMHSGGGGTQGWLCRLRLGKQVNSDAIR